MKSLKSLSVFQFLKRNISCLVTIKILFLCSFNNSWKVLKRGHFQKNGFLKVKTQQGVPSQPSDLRVTDVRATSVKLQWEQPAHSGENIVSYELYWNDTFTNDVSFLKKKIEKSKVHFLYNVFNVV